jgi:hypothetical protein
MFGFVKVEYLLSLSLSPLSPTPLAPPAKGEFEQPYLAGCLEGVLQRWVGFDGVAAFDELLRIRGYIICTAYLHDQTAECSTYH